MKHALEWFHQKKRWFCVLSILGTGILVFLGYRKGIFTDEEKMQAFISASGMLAPLVFMFIQAVQVVIPILPGAIGCVFGVAFFGAGMGFVYNYIGICIGSISAFFIARVCGRDFVKKMTGKTFFQKYSRFLMSEKQFERMLALLIFLPVAPDDFLCYLAGISDISYRRFILIILLGKPAAIFLYSMGLYQCLQFGIQWLGG